MIEKRFVERAGRVVLQVTFRLPETLWADEIFLVGDFNGWNRASHPMQRDRAGCWFLTLELAIGRLYQFRYLRDGAEWFNDDHADAYVYNHYGSCNFVVVADPHFTGYVDEQSSRPDFCEPSAAPRQAGGPQ